MFDKFLMKPYYLLLAVWLPLSLMLQSCGDEDEAEDSVVMLHNPGDVAQGAVGCSASQKAAIEAIPGMGNIATTTLGEDGSYIYADATGNTCTLDADGNMVMNGVDGSTVVRDHTVTESNSSQATELTGKVMTGTTECIYSSLYPENYSYNLETILKTFPEASAVIDVVTERNEKSWQNVSDYDSVSISFQREICIRTGIKRHKTETCTYTEVQKTYTAHDGWFDCKAGRLHLKFLGDNGDAVLYYMVPQYNETTGQMEYVDDSPFYGRMLAVTYISVENVDSRFTYQYQDEPSKAEYFSYRLMDNGNLLLTNQRKALVLERESKRFFEDREADIKFEVITPGSTGSTGDDEDEVIVAPPVPSIK